MSPNLVYGCWKKILTHSGLKLAVQPYLILIKKVNHLDDAIINFAQNLLNKQFPSINGLQNTLLQTKKQVDSEISQWLQVGMRLLCS